MATERCARRLTRDERVLRRRDFLQAYSQGSKTHSRFSVVFMMSNSLGHPRLGITVTKKIGKAVVRNRLKRVVREIYRLDLRELIGAEESVDLIVNMKRGSAEASYDELAADLKKAVEKSARRRGSR